MNRHSSRREFLRNGAFAGIGIWVVNSAAPAESKSPNEKLNIGIIGVGGRGAANTEGVQGESIVALADVDENHLEAAAKRFPNAKKYCDWRKLLEQKDIDAVVVSTPDHHHALASVAAMNRGKHVYCEKPLAHSVHEARVMQDTRKKAKVATQMGTQIHATDTYRRVVELIQSGAIGPVREAHVWCDRVGPAPGTTRPKDTPPIPKHLNWDLWLGPAPVRPYHPSYFGGCMAWEQWWDIGNGCLGDMGSHLIDLPFWALKLRRPKTVEAEGSNRSAETYPQSMIVRWEHPATKTRPAVKLTWYDGGKRPPAPAIPDFDKWGIGVLFIGDDGQLVADYGRKILLPEAKFKDFKPPKESIPPSLGHYQEWIHACKTGAPTLCNFGYSGALVENNLLGTVAFRVGKKIEWDAKNLKATNCPEADQYIRRHYRDGWEI
jgi:predicted dehydrogenase